MVITKLGKGIVRIVLYSWFNVVNEWFTSIVSYC